jgi:signal recognition particle GTPase
MARGWESKSVEEQQALAAEAKQSAGPRLNSEQAAHQREKQGLELSRQRVLQQLQSASNARHRRMLEDALADLEKKLLALSS